ncbi:ubiquinone/menaquinone biosynthesis methyltransferase, partial [Micrococcus endophyticus]
ANVPAHGRVLDLATGTGDLAFEVLRQHPDATVVGADISAEMMEVGRKREGGDRVEWVVADAQDLPFEDASFDSVTHGYLLRNVADIPAALAEQFRVLRPGGWMAALETSPPPANFIRPFSTFYMHQVMPRLARVITDKPEAYEYLSSSTKAFHAPEEIADMLADAGFVNIGHETHMFGTLATHWAMKPVA